MKYRVAGLCVAMMLAQTISASKAFAETTNWSSKMQELYQTLANVLTDASSGTRFNEPANAKRIQAEAESLASLTHDLDPKKMTTPDFDPTLRLINGMLKDETKLAVTDLKNGRRESARTILRSLPGYCIACHTRNSTGPQFSNLAIEPAGNWLTSLELGEFYAASRQFDRAQKQLISVIKNPIVAGAYTYEWQNAIGQSLAIAIRVQQSPTQANEIIQAILDSKTGPDSIKENARVWKTSVQEWIDEPKKTLDTEESLYNEAIRLMELAQQTQKYPMDRTSEVLYLRASAAIHNFLQLEPSGKHTPEMLFLAGICYEILSPLKLEDLHDLYYESCIRTAPHTKLSGRCYQRYEQSVIRESEANFGAKLPLKTQVKLMELRTLSQMEQLR